MKKVLVIDVTMKTLSPLYTGEVREEEKRASSANFPVRKTATGRAIIPFKGALRSTLEKMLHAKGEDVCNTGKSKARPCSRCTTCDLFGSMGRKGRVSTDFLMSEADRRDIVRQATHTRIDRDKGSVTDSFSKSWRGFVRFERLCDAHWIPEEQGVNMGLTASRMMSRSP